MPLDIIILAAGQGTRMHSRLPKVLQRLAGRPLLGHVLAAAAQLQARSVCVVTGHGAEAVQAAARDFVRVALNGAGGMALRFACQARQLGTGHAVQQALPDLPDDGQVLVLYGDVPLLSPECLRALLDVAADDHLALLTARLPDPAGYGRVVRDGSGQVRRIVEQKDASAAEQAINEVYSGTLAAPARGLKRWLARLDNNNAQREYYLTDVVAQAADDGAPVVAYCTPQAQQIAGVNTAAHLAALERAHQLAQAHALLEQGVRLADPGRFDLRDDPDTGQAAALLCAQDVEIDVGCIFAGRVEIGAGARIGAYCCIANARIGANARIAPYTHIDGAVSGASVGEDAHVGPFARLRAGTHLERAVHVGNFVEIKNSHLAAGAKANHLAYLGDASVGACANYGAGSITANYDGAHKHRTTIGADVHIGSNCVLVAPVRIGDGGTVAAGSTVTCDTPPGALTLARTRQRSIAGWQRPHKEKPAG